MCFSGLPALKACLAASSKRDGNELAWAVNVAPKAAAVWAKRTRKVAGDTAKNARAISELAFDALECQFCAAPAVLLPE